MHAGWNEIGPGTITTDSTHVKASISGTGSALELTQPGSDSKEGIYVKIEINNKVEGPCPDCPLPPNLTPPIAPILELGHMNIIITGNVLPTDTGHTFTVLNYSQPSHGTVTVNPDGTFSYTPGTGFVGIDSFIYIASDENGNVTDPITVTLTLTNALPTAGDASESGHMNIALDGSVIFSDTPDSLAKGEIDALTVVVTSQPTHGTVNFNTTTGTFTYTPTDTGYVGTDTFTYTVSDGQQGAEPAVGTVTLTLTNALPTAGDASESGHMNIALDGSVIFSDTPDNLANGEIDALTVVVTSQPTHGTVNFNTTTGTFTYTPTDAGYVGTDTFTYTVSDGQQGAAPATGTVTLTLTNALPTADDGSASGHMNIALDGSVIFSDTPDNLANGEIDALTVVVTSQPTHGTVNFNTTTGTFTYTPTDAGYVGTDTFTYTVSDGQQGAAPATGTVTLTLTNALPTAGDASESGHMNIALDGSVIFSDTPDSLAKGEIDALTVVVTSQPTHGTVNFNTTTGTFTYTPTDTGYVGTDSFTYTVSDGQQGAAPATGTVTLTLTNALPTADDGSASGHMNIALDGSVIFSDTPDNLANGEIDALTVVVTSQPTHGTVNFNTTTGTFTYTPTDAGYVGTDTFTYTVSDGQQGAAPATGTVTLTLTNALPTADDGSASGHMNIALDGSVIFSDTPDAILPTVR